jgi:hypothetical protein
MAQAAAALPQADAAREARQKALVRSILRGLNASSAEIEATAAISGDGLVIASVLGEGADPDRFGAMCASLLALANRAAQEIARGQLRQVLVEGEKGTMLLVQAGDDAVLAVAARPTVNLGMVFIEAKHTALKVANAMTDAW